MANTILERIYQKIVSVKNSVETVLKYTNTLWVVVGDNDESLKLVFKDDGRLIISKKGAVTTGTYELLGSSDAMIITIDGTAKLYNHIYADEGMVFMQLDDDKTKPFVLVNQALLKGVSAQDYLQNTYLNIKQKPLNSSNLEVLDTAWYGSSRMQIFRDRTTGLKYAYSDSGPLESGIYSFKGDRRVQFEVGTNGELVKFHIPKSYKLKNGDNLTLHEDPIEGLVNGCKVFLNDSPAPDGRYRLSMFRAITVKDGVIESSSW